MLAQQSCGGKKSNMLNRTMMRQTLSPTSFRSPTGTDLVAHHSQHLQQKHSQKLHSVSRNWEHTCQLHEQTDKFIIVMYVNLEVEKLKF
jgi:hypothetical protein